METNLTAAGLNEQIALLLQQLRHQKNSARASCSVEQMNNLLCSAALCHDKGNAVIVRTRIDFEDSWASARSTYPYSLGLFHRDLLAEYLEQVRGLSSTQGMVSYSFVLPLPVRSHKGNPEHCFKRPDLEENMYFKTYPFWDYPPILCQLAIPGTKERVGFYPWEINSIYTAKMPQKSFSPPYQSLLSKIVEAMTPGKVNN